LRPVIKECNEHLEDAPTKQSEAAGRILHALVSSAPQASDKVSKGVLPVLFTLYNGSESITRRRGLLEAFNQVTAGFAKMTGAYPGADCTALQAFADNALEAMVRALVSAPKAEVSFRMASLTGLAQLVSVPGLLSDKQTSQAVDTVTNLVLHERLEGHGDIRTPAIKALSSMALNVPQAVRDRSIPAFMVELPDVPGEGIVLSTVLEAFAHLATESQIFDTVVLRLKNKLRSARHQRASLAYQRALLFAILYAFTFGSPARDDGVMRSAYYADYADPLITDFVEDVSSETDPVVVDVVGRIANIILRPQSVHLQSTVYHRALEWLSPGDAKASGTSQHITPFLLYFYAAIRPEVTEAADIVGLLKAQTTSALRAGASSPAVVTTLRLISLLVNKFANPKTMQATLAETGLEVETLMHDSPSPEAIQAAFAVTKGLLIQGKSGALTTRYLQTLLDLLSAPNPTTTAQYFTTLLAPDEILSKENHCLISGLSQQKFFNQAIPALTTAIRTAHPAQKPAYLTALTGLLRHLPYTLLSPSLALLTPPLLQTLDLSSTSPDQAAKASALIIFESALMHDAPTLTEHTSSLVTRLLNSTSTTANGAGVRAKALQCLALVPRQLKREAVVPFRREVVRRLLACLDDGRRSVRGEAVRCRTAWLGLDEGGEEED